MKTQFIYLYFLSISIMFSATYSQIIPDFQVNENVGGAEQSGCSISADSSGNFVITWADARNGWWDVYAQRYSSDGTILGSNFKVNDSTGSLMINPYDAPPPSISSDNSGNFVITWTDDRNDDVDIYAQRYSSDGSALGSNFKVNEDEGYSHYYPSISSDSNGNFMIIWMDNRNEGLDIYAQRYSSDGIALGSNFQVNDSTGSAGWTPSISTDGDGNFVITWEDVRNGDWDIYAQRYSSDGSRIGLNFKVNDDEGNKSQDSPAISTDGSGNFVITWEDGRNGDEDIYAQRYSNDATALGSNFRVNNDNGYTHQWTPYVSTDDSGNFVITWGDDRNHGDIYAQRYSSDGTVLGSNVKVNSITGSVRGSESLSISTDGNGNFVITWGDVRNVDEDIYAQRFSSDGTVLGSNFKVNDDEESGNQTSSSISTDDNGNFVIIWTDMQDDYGWDYYGDIYAQCYASDGNALGTNFKVNNSTGTAGWTPSIATDGSGNFVITWTDRRNGDQDIYAQRYSSDGTALGSNIKVNNDDGNADQVHSSISTDKAGGFVITWRDGRNDRMDIYAQRYSSEGIALGDNFKVNNSDDVESHTGHTSSIASDSNGNFVITWQDEGIDHDVIYAQRYSSDGIPLEGNFKVNDYEGYTGWPTFISSDENGNFVITWEDGRNGHPDIYAQRYASDGSALGSNFKVNDNDSFINQYEISISLDGSGNIVIAWADEHDGDTKIYAQRYSSDGSAMGENFQVSNTGSSPDVNLWNGRIYSTWADNRGHETGYDIWANVLDWDNPVGISDKDIPQIPSAYQLSQNYPNPFNPRTIINYELPTTITVELSIYNMLGQKVATLVNTRQQAGYHQVEWDASGFASGIYYYKISSGEFQDVKKMILLQ